MGAFIELSKYFSKGIVQTASEMGYSASNLAILSGDETELRSHFPEVWNNIMTCSHNRDARTPFEYAQDLVASWIFEDCLIQKLNDAGLPVFHAGADKTREILSGGNVSARSDAVIAVKGKNVPLEIMSDYKGYWTRYSKIDLRDNKYNELHNSQSLFVGVSTTDSKVILLDFSKPLNVTFIASHRPYGGKPAYSIQISPGDLIPFNMGKVIATIKGMI